MFEGNKNNEIGQRIKELREQRNETQTQLANALLVKRETVAQWENGDRDLKTHYTIELSKHFGVTADWLLGLSGTKKLEDSDITGKTGLSGLAVDTLLKFAKNYDIYYQPLDVINAIIEVGNDDFYRSMYYYLLTDWHIETKKKAFVSHAQVIKYHDTPMPQEFEINREIIGKSIINQIWFYEVQSALKKIYERLERVREKDLSCSTAVIEFSLKDKAKTTNDIPEHTAILNKLATQHGVSEEQLIQAIAYKGYFPMNTPIEDYPASFVDFLVNVWPQVLETIAELKKASEPWHPVMPL